MRTAGERDSPARPFGRATGLLRNARLVVARTGLTGFFELLAARALPDTLSYERTFILRSACVGEPHPELAPRRLRSLEPEVARLFAELARTREPEISRLAESDLLGRFERGYELWLFQVDGQIVHLRWVSPGPLVFTGFALPLDADERVAVGTLTLPAARQRGLARTAILHIRHVLAGEGATALFGFVNGSNRRWHAGMLRNGYSAVATVHVASLAGRRFLRVAPFSQAESMLLTRRGLRTDAWIRVHE